MNYLKGYKIFESDQIETKFFLNSYNTDIKGTTIKGVELKSIDKALDIDTGVSYDIIRPGVCDGDNPEYHIENAPLSEEDRDIVDKYTTYSKGLVDVDEDFIEDIRDILLVVIDNNYSPSIVTNMGSVFISSKSFGIKKDWDYYVDLFPSDIRSMKSSKINYSIQIKKQSYWRFS